MFHRTLAVSAPYAVALSAALTWLGGCAGADTSSTEQPSALEAALTSPILKCQEDHASCIGTAKSLSDAQSCDKAFGSCLMGANTQQQATATGFQKCQQDAATCLQTNGAKGAAQCRTDFEACANGLAPAGSAGTGGGAAGAGGLPPFPTGGAGTSGLPPFPTGGAGTNGLPPFPTGGAGTSGLPTPPSFPGAGDGGLPTPAAPPGLQCLKDLRACVQAGTDPNSCADTARMCLHTQLSGKP
jgi:hypothetical protein